MTLVAVTFGGGPHGRDIGVGAALGGPLVVGTIAYATVGATLIVRNRQARSRQGAPTRVSDARDPDGGSAGAPVDPAGTIVGINTGRLARHQTWFLAIEQHRQRRDGNSEPKIHGKHKPAGAVAEHT